MVGNRDYNQNTENQHNQNPSTPPHKKSIKNDFFDWNFFISFSSVFFPFWQLFSKTAFYQDRLTEMFRYEWTKFRFSVRNERLLVMCLRY